MLFLRHENTGNKPFPQFLANRGRSTYAQRIDRFLYITSQISLADKSLKFAMKKVSVNIATCSVKQALLTLNSVAVKQLTFLKTCSSCRTSSCQHRTVRSPQMITWWPHPRKCARCVCSTPGFLCLFNIRSHVILSAIKGVQK